MKYFENKEFAKNFEKFIEGAGFIRVFGIKIRSLEALWLFRVSLVFSAIIIISFSGFFTGKNTVIFAGFVALILYLLPAEIIKGKIKAMAAAIRSSLPDCIDMMASLMQAGLNLDEAIKYISNNFNNPVSKLFKIYQLLVFEGSSSKDAFEKISGMSFCTEFKNFIKIIHQSEVVGNPVKNILKDLSKVYRNNQRDFLKMRAEKLESNLIIVIFIFIFIPMLMIFLIPVLPQLSFFLMR